MVGAVGELASMKRPKLWKTGRGGGGGGLCCSSSVVQSRLGPGGGGGGTVLLQQCRPISAGSLVIARRTE